MQTVAIPTATRYGIVQASKIIGEGVLNGLMTARFGLAAIAVCRPLPFLREEPPRLGDVAGELLTSAGAEAPGR